jgi:hypothetical protein
MTTTQNSLDAYAEIQTQRALDQLRENFHKLESGRWIVAYWNRRDQQWQSSDLCASSRRAQGTGYCYTYSRTLERLVGEGIKTYPTRAKAIRAAASENPWLDEDTIKMVIKER